MIEWWSKIYEISCYRTQQLQCRLCSSSYRPSGRTGRKNVWREVTTYGPSTMNSNKEKYFLRWKLFLWFFECGQELTIHQKPRLPLSFPLFYVHIQKISFLIWMPKNRAAAGRSSFSEPKTRVSFYWGFFKGWARGYVRVICWEILSYKPYGSLCTYIEKW